MSGILDILKTAWTISVSDTKARYRRTVVGPFWIVITTGLGVVGLGAVWSVLFGVEFSKMIQTLAVGLVFWGFIANTIIESTNVFIANAPVILNYQIDKMFFVAKLMSRSIINFLHASLILIGVLVFYAPDSIHFFTFFCFFVLVTIYLSSLTVIIGYISLRYRDLEHLINAIMPMVFLLTPVLYDTNRFGVVGNILYLNPIAIMIQVVRAPLLGQALTNVEQLIFVTGFVISTTLAIYIKRKHFDALARWL
jgi:ABC-type polysaccharide/polyol phosphate export permease